MQTMTTMSPQAAAQRLQTFSTIRQPGVHLARVTCEQAGCVALQQGFVIRVDESDPMGARCAQYVRHVTKRRFTERLDEPSGLTIFTFAPGTPCLKDGRDRRAQMVFGVNPHLKEQRPALHVVSAGSARTVQAEIARSGRPAEIIRTHTRPQDWSEHLAESWNTMAHQINT